MTSTHSYHVSVHWHVFFDPPFSRAL